MTADVAGYPYAEACYSVVRLQVEATPYASVRPNRRSVVVWFLPPCRVSDPVPVTHRWLLAISASP